MKRWFHNLRRLWSGAEWFYITRPEMHPYAARPLNNEFKTIVYAKTCNTSGLPIWYAQRGRAETFHATDVKNVLREYPDALLWTKEEFEEETKEQIVEECT